MVEERGNIFELNGLDVVGLDIGEIEVVWLDIEGKDEHMVNSLP